MDGVLINTEALGFREWKELFSPLGAEITQDYYQNLVGSKTFKAIQKTLADFKIEGDVVELSKKKRELHYEYLKEVEVSEGARELLKEAKEKGWKLGLATNSHKKNVDAVLEHGKFQGIFDSVFSGDDVAEIKPNPEIYLKSLKALGVEARNAVAVEDSSPGIDSAKNAGMKCIGLVTEFTSKHDFSRADLAVKSLKEVSVEKIEELVKK